MTLTERLKEIVKISIQDEIKTNQFDLVKQSFDIACDELQKNKKNREAEMILDTIKIRIWQMPMQAA